MTAIIEIKEYDSFWPEIFQTEKAFLEAIVKDWLYGRIEHVGSTAVPGLSAKPVIDIMLGVKSLDDSKGAIKVLESNGYCYAPYKTELMHWFCKPSEHYRTHHLHLIPFNSALWHERIAFRDILRANPPLASEYAARKKELAFLYANDREAYTNQKWPFIKQVLEQANVPRDC